MPLRLGPLPPSRWRHAWGCGTLWRWRKDAHVLLCDLLACLKNLKALGHTLALTHTCHKGEVLHVCLCVHNRKTSQINRNPCKTKVETLVAYFSLTCKEGWNSHLRSIDVLPRVSGCKDARLSFRSHFRDVCLRLSFLLCLAATAIQVSGWTSVFKANLQAQHKQRQHAQASAKTSA